MAQPVPLEYSGSTPQSKDLVRLRRLARCHYIWGGLTIAFGCVFLLYCAIGFYFAIYSYVRPDTSIDSTLLMIISIFLFLDAIIMTLGVYTIISGSRLSQQRSHRLSTVIAAFNCVFFPFGTILGVFTILTLTRDSVKLLYRDNDPASQLIE